MDPCTEHNSCPNFKLEDASTDYSEISILGLYPIDSEITNSVEQFLEQVRIALEDNDLPKALAVD